MSVTETGRVTGTKDKDYDLLWYVESCLDNALRLQTCVQDAESAGDDELAELFRKAQAASRKGAAMGKNLLAARLGGMDSMPYHGEGSLVGPDAMAAQGDPGAPPGRDPMAPRAGRTPPPAA